MFQNKILTVLILCLIPFFGSCRCSKEKTPPKNFRPTVSADGVKLSFHPESPGLKQIGTVEFGSKSEFVSVLAPARIIATISTSVSGGKIVLFETPEINAQYASYIASKNTRIRASKNLARIRDMYKNQVATEKDIIEAEADANNAQAQFAEFEGKLRALGFNPNELQSVRSNIVWIISDVPETNLSAVSRGKEVKVFLNSFPDLKLTGRVEAIGDNVDPGTRTIRARIAMPNKGSQFRPGMYAKVEFTDKSSAAGAGVLPYMSLVTVESKNYVFVEKSPGEFERREVTIGSSGLDKISIVEGIGKGETVVTTGAMLLKGLSFGY